MDLPKPAELKPREETPEPEEIQQNIPQLATVVLDTAKPAFARIVEAAGPVIVAQAPSVASAPPKNDFIPAPQQQAPQATKFTPNASDTEGGYYPRPEYPVFARKNRYQGSGRIDILVDAAGAVTSVKVTQSCGYNVLDEAISDVVKNRWRFPPGALRHFWYPFVFTMQ